MRPTPSILFATLLMVAGPWAVRPSHATSVHYRTLPELVHKSDVTLLGHAIGQESFWQGTRILTRVRLAVEEVWAGAAPRLSYVDVVTPGGVVGTIGQRVDGAAVVPTSGQVVMHLRAHEGEYLPVAMAQGMWIVSAADATGEHALIRPSADRVVFGLRKAEQHPPTTLTALRRAVMEAAHAP